MRFLDVGQGDATLIQHPDGTAILFDGGPPEAGVVRLLRRAGVRRLALVVATHASRDHHGGLAAVLSGFPVGLLLDGGDGTRDRAFRAMLAEADRRGVRRLAALAPLDLRAGGLRVRVLSPPPRPPGPPPEDPNPRAVAAIVAAGDFQLLLSGDAESPTLAHAAAPGRRRAQGAPPRQRRSGPARRARAAAARAGRHRGRPRQHVRPSRAGRRSLRCVRPGCAPIAPTATGPSA